MLVSPISVIDGNSYFVLGACNTFSVHRASSTSSGTCARHTSTRIRAKNRISTRLSFCIRARPTCPHFRTHPPIQSCHRVALIPPRLPMRPSSLRFSTHFLNSPRCTTFRGRRSAQPIWRVRTLSTLVTCMCSGRYVCGVQTTENDSPPRIVNICKS